MAEGIGMSTYSTEALKEILRKHAAWLRSEPDGERANLSCANLSGANLSRANLSRAYLSCANLSGADLSCADLSRAYLSCANLSGADLSCANLSGADLSRAYLSRAYLSCANLSGANLSRANLSGAYLSCANLSGADLSCANVDPATLPPFQLAPEIGGFYGFKKLKDGLVAKLYIPEDARRTSNLKGRKLRAEYVEVIEILAPDGTPRESGTSGLHQPKHTLTYRVGHITKAHEWCDDVREDCAPGIHFFLTRREAVEYQG